MKAPTPLVPHSIEGARVSVTHVTQDSERPVRTFAQSGTRKRIHDHASKSPSSLRRRQGRNDIVGSPGLPRNGEALHHRRQCIENFECSARCYSIRTINLSGGQSLFPTTKGCPARGWRGAACGGGGCTRTRYRDLEPDRRIIFDARAWLAAAARFGVRRDFI
jgi:hypothetical protein